MDDFHSVAVGVAHSSRVAVEELVGIKAQMQERQSQSHSAAVAICPLDQDPVGLEHVYCTVRSTGITTSNDEGKRDMTTP
jgi:hypothetical protein